MKEYSIATGEEIGQTAKSELNSSKYKKVNTPFGYFGSKNKIALQLCKKLPKHNCWVELFCGSAALTLSKPPAMIEVINDIDDEIINVFEQLRDNSDKLYRLISLTPYSRKELEKARIQNKYDNDLERARKFLVQAMMAVNGIFGEQKGGFSYSQSYSRKGMDARVSRWHGLPERLTYVVERLRLVRVESCDAIVLLRKFINRPASLIYLDPPYYAKRTNGYKIDAREGSFHKRLLEIANEAKCMIFISGYDNELYNRLLTKQNGWQNKSIKTITKDSRGQHYDRVEKVWMNKCYLKALELDVVPIKLTDKEVQYGKINPER